MVAVKQLFSINKKSILDYLPKMLFQYLTIFHHASLTLRIQFQSKLNQAQ